MAVSYMDFTAPNVQFTYDLNQNITFQKDNRNYITELSIKQLNTLGNVSLLDIFLSKDNLVEPHYHQNSTELVYCISGAALISVLNPFTQELLHFPIKPGQVANVPQGWWHYDAATEDNTHLLAIFDAPIPDVIFGSDILRLTPPEVLAHSYCLDRDKIKSALAPIKETVVIGPPKDCHSQQVHGAAAAPAIKFGPAQTGHNVHHAPAPGGYGVPEMTVPAYSQAQYGGPGMSAPADAYGYAGTREPAVNSPTSMQQPAQPSYQSHAHPYAHLNAHHPSCRQYGHPVRF
ncbi:cupin domain-containing protein [Paenibacillus sp. 1P07SE]|uniref:cupin domain-containing protein n=1 Tax=Paenibacillus sp. 1P07SE TaxID=3132209 RepID=UPI0039A767C9